MENEPKPARILIVDDEGDMLMLLDRILSERMPCEVTITDEPFKVRELLMEGDFDLVISDLLMPGYDGFQVLEEVKRLSTNTAVIVMSAYATPAMVAEALRRDAFDFIKKPFRKEAVMQVVERAVRSRCLPDS